MTNPKSKIQNPKSPPRGFTLMELLIVITIIAILAGLVVSGLIGATNQARAARTRAQIMKIDTLIMERYEGYRTRAVRVPHNPSAIVTAGNRLSVLRELMRFELPDRKTDVTDDSGLTPAQPTPSLTLSYRRLTLRAAGSFSSWSRQHQGAECLYLILATMKDGDKSALDYFSPDEVGDVDGDGMKELLDGWGQPIEFLRWAPGYSEHPGPDTEWGFANVDDDGNGVPNDIYEAGWPGSDDIKPLTLQTRIAFKHPTNLNIEYAPDPFDPLKIDSRWSSANPPFALKPLIFSAGQDKVYDVTTVLEDPNPPSGPGPVDFRYSRTGFYPAPPDGSTRPANDPYFWPPLSWTNQFPLGTPNDANADGTISTDNITNHFDEGQ
jgi:prepilin-type N-terminal cleavage/methylation domain-containing protein